MDRFDDLLIKARAEMLGKSQPRQVITKDTAFSMAWNLTKGFEDQMRAMQARQQRPGFMQRIKNKVGERKTPQQSVSNNLQQIGGQGLRQEQQITDSIPLPTRQQGEFNDPFGQATGDVNTPTTSSRASGEPPTMANLGPGGFGQGGGAEKPLEPSQVPMREEINTEQPPAPTPSPVETERTRSLPPTMRREGISASQRAKNFGAPSDDEFVSAVQTLVPDSDYRSLLSEVNERRRGKEPREEGVTPLSSADVKQGSPMPELTQRTQGKIGDRLDTAANEKYQEVSDKRKEYAEAMERFVERGDMTEDESFKLWEEMQQSGSIPKWPKMKEQAQPSLVEANRALGGETLSPNQKREAVEPTRQKTTTQEYKRPINRNNLPVPIRKPSNTALSTRGEEKIEPLDEIPMQDGSVRQLGSGPIRNPLQLGEGRSPLQLTEGDGEQKTSQAKAGRKLERQNPNIIDNFKRPKRKRTPKKKEPEPQTDLPEPGETRGALDENETAMGRAMLEAIRDSGFGQPQEKTESVKQPKPQDEEQATKLPTAKQTTLFGGGEESAPVEDKKATETEAKERSKRRKTTRESTEATTKVGGEKGGSNEQEQSLPRISSTTDTEVLNELMNRAEEGDEAARKHLYNSMGDLEDHHPSVAERFNDAFGKMIQDADLSLLPSGMRNSLLKDNNADVNYSLLPNGWV